MARSGSQIIFNSDGSMSHPLASGYWLSPTILSSLNLNFTNKWTVVIRVSGNSANCSQLFFGLDPSNSTLTNSFIILKSA